MAYVGDGNNVCHSLMHGAAILGAELIAVTPKGRECDEEITAEARAIAEKNGGKITVTTDVEAVKGVDAVYTDVWVSMRPRSERRRKSLREGSVTVSESRAQRAHVVL